MYVLDTNVVSELRKVRMGKADAHFAKWADKVETTDLYLSAITIQELEIGILLAERRDPRQGAVFRSWMNAHVLPAFTGRILPMDTVVAQRSARLHVPDPTHEPPRSGGNSTLPSPSGRRVGDEGRDASFATAIRDARAVASLPVRDGLIAATALVHGMTIVTRNVSDFETTGVRILYPWIRR